MLYQSTQIHYPMLYQSTQIHYPMLYQSTQIHYLYNLYVGTFNSDVLINILF